MAENQNNNASNNTELRHSGNVPTPTYKPPKTIKTFDVSNSTKNPKEK